MTPRNADNLIQTRLSGERPADPVVVSFVGDTGWGNIHVFADSGVDYDWRFLFGLPVYIVVKPGVDCRDAVRQIFDVADLYPTLVDVESKTAASVIANKPFRLWPMSASSAAWRNIFQ